MLREWCTNNNLEELHLRGAQAPAPARSNGITQSFSRYLWSKMPECSQTSIEDDDQAVLAIIHFALGFQRHRRTLQRKVAPKSWAAVFALQKGLLGYLAAGLDTYLLHVYMPARPTAKPAPSYQSPPKKRRPLAPAQG